MQKHTKVPFALEFMLEPLKRSRAGKEIRQIGREIVKPVQPMRNWAKS